MEYATYLLIVEYFCPEDPMFSFLDDSRYSGGFHVFWEEFGGDVHVLLRHHRCLNVIHAFPPLFKLQIHVFWHHLIVWLLH